MRLRNKTTGEIVNFIGMCVENDRYELTVRLSENDKIFKFYYYSIEELSEKWEDYEEQKKYYFITSCGEITHRGYRLWENESVYDKKRKEIGNYFDTEEEAEKAVEKLKALKRLKDNGFKFEGIKEDYTRICQEPVRTGKRYLQFNKSENEEWMKENWDDLDLLFGGEK